MTLRFALYIQASSLMGDYEILAQNDPQIVPQVPDFLPFHTITSRCRGTGIFMISAANDFQMTLKFQVKCAPYVFFLVLLNPTFQNLSLYD